ncbi:MAG: DUF3108 domain-containing protein [Deltaproteobacteria bacterium]|nr:DUF3108 domain-containing protein [Deltaproteobacteria bacterium]
MRFFYKSSIIFAVVVCLLRVECGGTPSGAVETVAPPVLKPETLVGEVLTYSVGFWIFRKAATGKLSLQRDGERYVATFEAETAGFLKLVTEYRKEVMRSTMRYDNATKRLRPEMFEEIYTQGDHEVVRTVLFDYEQKRYRFSWKRNERTVFSVNRAFPKRPFDDLLSFFYNLRLGAFGPVQAGEKKSACIVAKTSPGNIVIDFAGPGRKRKGPGKWFGTLTLDREMTQAHSEQVSCWFSSELVPVKGVVEDAVFFGDLKIRLTGQARAEGPQKVIDSATVTTR